MAEFFQVNVARIIDPVISARTFQSVVTLAGVNGREVERKRIIDPREQTRNFYYAFGRHTKFCDIFAVHACPRSNARKAVWNTQAVFVTMATRRSLTSVWDTAAVPSIRQVPKQDPLQMPYELRFMKTGSPVASHLGFQMGLFFNVWYSPFWAAVSIYAICYKFALLDDILAALAPIFVALSILMEICRLYFGYYGNLFENPASLGAFFLITIFLQIPLLVVPVSSYRFRTPAEEWWMDIVLLGFILFELTTGWLAYKQISAVQTQKLLATSSDK